MQGEYDQLVRFRYPANLAEFLEKTIQHIFSLVSARLIYRSSCSQQQWKRVGVMLLYYYMMSVTCCTSRASWLACGTMELSNFWKSFGWSTVKGSSDSFNSQDVVFLSPCSSSCATLASFKKQPCFDPATRVLLVMVVLKKFQKSSWEDKWKKKIYWSDGRKRFWHVKDWRNYSESEYHSWRAVNAKNIWVCSRNREKYWKNFPNNVGKSL